MATLENRRPETPDMADKLDGKTIAILATEGVEQIELTEPRKARRGRGREGRLLSLEAGDFQGFNHLDKGDTFTADKAVADAASTTTTA